MEKAARRSRSLQNFKARKGHYHPLPNGCSPLATPASTAIDLHYARIGIRHRWTWERYIRLAGFLNYTPAELASVICVRHSTLRVLQRENRFTGPACLLLTMLEARAAAAYIPDVIKDPFDFTHSHDSPQSP